MTDSSIIDEVEGHYPDREPYSSTVFCHTDSQPWPCLTQRLVAEVQRLRAIAPNPDPCVCPTCRNARYDLARHAGLTSSHPAAGDGTPSSEVIHPFADVVAQDIQHQVDGEIEGIYGSRVVYKDREPAPRCKARGDSNRLCELDAGHHGPHRSHDFTGVNYKWDKGHR